MNKPISFVGAVLLICCLYVDDNLVKFFGLMYIIYLYFFKGGESDGQDKGTDSLS